MPKQRPHTGGASARKRPAPPPHRPGGKSAKKAKGAEPLWLYGRHAVQAALANPRRRVARLLATAAYAERFGPSLERNADRIPPLEIVEPATLDRLLGDEAVHQGVALAVRPLMPFLVEDLLAETAGTARAMVLVLDSVTDPRNVGAMLRSAAAFGAAGVIVLRHHAAAETGALAKAASGALDLVPLAEATNLQRALDQLKAAEFWCLGLDHPAPAALGSEPPPARTAWVLGAEGRGLRPLTAKNCDARLEIPISSAMESLNVSNAAAIALYEWARHHYGDR